MKGANRKQQLDELVLLIAAALGNTDACRKLHVDPYRAAWAVAYHPWPLDALMRARFVVVQCSYVIIGQVGLPRMLDTEFAESSEERKLQILFVLGLARRENAFISRVMPSSGHMQMIRKDSTDKARKAALCTLMCLRQQQLPRDLCRLLAQWVFSTRSDPAVWGITL